MSHQNCLAAVGIGCVCCCQFGCSLERTRATLAFLPPSPASYRVEQDAEDRSKGKIVYMNKELGTSEIYRLAASASEVFWVTPRKNMKTPLVWVRQGPEKTNQSADGGNGPLVLLHCHGNATDIGIMMAHYFELAHSLGIDVVGIEYSGYGASDGTLHTTHVKTDIEAAYNFISSKGIPRSRIVAYGQSIGSAPTSHLAARRELGGLVLHSPFASGLRVVDPRPDKCCRPSCVICCFDVFRNDKQMPSVKCPVFIMHGKCDDVVPFHNAELLHSKCKEGVRWPAYFVSRAGHNDLVQCDVRTYFQKLANFLAHVRVHAGLPALELPPPEVRAPNQVQMEEDPGDGAGKIGPATIGHASASGEQAGAPWTKLATAEPKSGPEDGMYERLRNGEAVGQNVPLAVISEGSASGQNGEAVAPRRLR
eukprot:TRINITY_DN16426_c0_g1_i1.p1 TRINITY_DN16426_c0_g1~~TRINITY_DN16426_c0_g1_i1.p1  ORF type:complete len:422 (-),score=53.37 TRINITY_DN16426_c0_g1_i1:248-1513(-)